MFWACEFGSMNKGKVIQFLKGNTTHRFPKIMTLAVASSVLVTMVTIDASATTREQVPGASPRSRPPLGPQPVTLTAEHASQPRS